MKMREVALGMYDLALHTITTSSVIPTPRRRFFSMAKHHGGLSV